MNPGVDGLMFLPSTVALFFITIPPASRPEVYSESYSCGLYISLKTLPSTLLPSTVKIPYTIIPAIVEPALLKYPPEVRFFGL